MDEIWRYERLKKEQLSRGGSRKNGRMFARGKRVGVAKVKNGVLHIAAPPSACLLRPLKQAER
jgi:hypothetical protein